MRGATQGGGKPVVYLETNDAGALFRFTDTYPRMIGGQMWVAMDPPTLDHAPQDGVLNVRDFSIRGESGAGSRRVRRAGRRAERRRVQRACAWSSRAQPGRMIVARRRGARADRRRDHRRQYRLRRITMCICAAHSFRSTASTTRSGKFRSSACSSAATRKACSASPMRSSGRRAARCCASIRSRRSRRACCASFSNFRIANADRVSTESAPAYAEPQLR